MSTNYTIDINAKDNTKGAMGSVGGGLTTLNNKASKLKLALGAAAIAGAGIMAGKAVLGAIDNMDALAKSARAAGSATSNEAFQGFQVMKQAMNEAGIDAATFDRAMLQTNSRLKAGTEGQKSFAAVTDKLGDSIKNSNGELKSGPELLQAMMNALNEGKITTEDFAKVVGGRAGPLIQEQFASLNTSAEDLQATLDDVAKNSNIVDVGAAENAELFNDTLGRLKEGMGQLMTDAITPLLPVLTQLATGLMEKMPAIIDGVTEAFDTLKPVLSLIGTVISEILWPMLQNVFNVLGTIAEAIAPLVDKSIPAIKEGFETAGVIIDGLVTFFVNLIEKIKAIPEEVKKMKEAIVGKMGDMVEGTKKKLNGWKDSVLGIFKSTEDEAVGNSIIPDMVDAIIDEFVRMKDVTVDETKMMSEGITGEMDHGMNDFTRILSNGFDKGKLEMGDFKGFFKSTLSSMVKDAIFSSNKMSMSLGSSLHGSGGNKKKGFFGSLLGGIGNAIIPGLGSMFGRASGGPVTGNKSYLVGEQGPELFTPSGNGRITRNGEGGGSDGLVVNFNLNSIDSRSGTEFILEQKTQIVGMINDAYTKRGKMGIY
jgi:phage-related protein